MLIVTYTVKQLKLRSRLTYFEILSSTVGSVSVQLASVTWDAKFSLSAEAQRRLLRIVLFSGLDGSLRLHDDERGGRHFWSTGLFSVGVCINNLSHERLLGCLMIPHHVLWAHPSVHHLRHQQQCRSCPSAVVVKIVMKWRHKWYCSTLFPHTYSTDNYVAGNHTGVTEGLMDFWKCQLNSFTCNDFGIKSKCHSSSQ